MKKNPLYRLLLSFAVTFSMLSGIVGHGSDVWASSAPPTVTENGQTWVEIYTADQLKYINENQSLYKYSNIKLMNNIDLSGYSWVPLTFGDIIWNSGIFNGQGYRVTGVNVNSDDGNVGFIGVAYGTIMNLGVVGSVESTTCDRYCNVGGLIGVLSRGSVINSYFSGTVTGSKDNRIGGLVGQLQIATIQNSFSEGVIHTSQSNTVGGLVGLSSGTINNSYAYEVINVGNGSDVTLGGLVGANDRQLSGTISNSYASTTISGVGVNNSLGGLVGHYYGNMGNNYFNTTTVGSLPSSGLGSSSGTGVDENAMRTQSTFSGWDFTNVWAMSSNGVNNNFPYLRPQVLTDSFPSDSSLPDAVLGQAYSVTLHGFDSSRQGLTWQATGLPTGISVSSEGVLSGTPSQSGTFSVTLTATDNLGTTATKTLSLTVQELPSGLQHNDVTSESWTESWTGVSGADSYNVYLDGVLAGNTTSTSYAFANKTPGTAYTVTVKAVISGVEGLGSDADTVHLPAQTAGSVSLSASTIKLISGQSATVTGVVYDLYGSVFSDEQVTLSSSIGHWSGTNDTIETVTSNTYGAFSAEWTAPTVTTQTSASVSASVYGSSVTLIPISIEVAPPIIIVTSALADAKQGSTYSETLEMYGGFEPFAWSIESGSLPVGLTLDSSSGAISGIPTSSGTSTFTVRLTDAEGNTTSAPLSLEVLANNALLSALALNDETLQTAVTLSPIFKPATTVYAASVAYDVSSVTVTASVSDFATLTVNGTTVANGSSSGAIPLSVGTNTIPIVVTAQDGTTTSTYTVTVTRASDPSESSDPSDAGSNGPDEDPSGITDDEESPGIITENVTEQDGKIVQTITVESRKLADQLDQAEDNANVVIQVTDLMDQVNVELNGDAIQSMGDKLAVLDIQTPIGNYKLPARQIDLEQISKQLRPSVRASDIQLNVSIERSSDTTVQIIENAANKEQFSIVVPPVDFTITATFQGKSVNVDTFSTYIEREIPIPDGVDPSEVTTAVVLNPDGTTNPVPTKMVIRDGKTYAVVNSLTNSTYVLIHYSANFTDVTAPWAQGAVNDLASRMIISGVDRTHFDPNADITRAQFAAIVIRALGIADNSATFAFSDVSPNQWYAGAVAQAQAYGIVNGYSDGTFRPNQTITREEAMVMIARAMEIAGMNTAEMNEKRDEADRDMALASFQDHGQVAPWAKQAVAEVVANDLVLGDEGRLMPKKNITRAETAVLVKRLLVIMNLI